MTESNRREFLKYGAAGAAALGLVGTSMAQERIGVGTPVAPGAGGAMPDAAIPGAVNSSGEWVLPDLRYEYDALEPHIDAQTMRLHHSIHHLSYVNGLKAAEARLAEMRESGDFALAEHFLKKASFHGGGHFLHCVFWDSMGPDGGGEATGAVARLIARDFGSFAKFKAQFSAAAGSVEGSGWAVLGMQLAAGNRLTILQSEKHNLLSQWGIVPILAVDVWEHAYYLSYQNRRAAYVEAWWNTVDWARIDERVRPLL